VSDSDEFRSLLKKGLESEITPEVIERVVTFREEVIKENEVQNLTRLLSPKDFYEGHVEDVVHLQKSGFLQFPALDLGAGMGVPGLLHALMYAPEGLETWISCDSEGMKADFAQRTIDYFGLQGVSAESMRGEDLLQNQEVIAVVARAVGPVSRIYGWIRNRSTWNNLILFKGPKWDEEWQEFEKSSHKGHLKIDKTYEYRTGTEQKERKIIRLVRA
jgi:16S rRNA G527 N7-methylase RsmG